MALFHFLVEGRVQGVGYRRFAQSAAQKLGLSGWTRNLHDGRVELICEASQEQLAVLKRQLQQGPQFSVVTRLTVRKIEGDVKLESGFQIIADGDRIYESQ